MDEVLKKITTEELIIKNKNQKFNISIKNNISLQEKYNQEYTNVSHFVEWPVVYIIYNKKLSIAYVGQTTDLKTRLMQHYKDENKIDFRNSKNTKVLYFDIKEANLSMCINLEHLLIKYMNFDNKFKMCNGNSGITRCHYFDDDNFETTTFKAIWNKLKEIKIVNANYKTIHDNQSIKYSPYLALNNEQHMVVSDIVKEIAINNCKTIVVEGSAGTGKTAIAIHLLKLLNDYSKNINNVVNDFMVGESIDDVYKINEYFKNKKNMRIGIVFPMKYFCNVMRKNFKKIVDLNHNEYIFQPNEVADYYTKNHKKFDILIIDEAQRLTTPNFAHSNLSNAAYDKREAKLKLDKNADRSQLEWMSKISEKQIYFYDVSQRISKGDIDYNISRNKWLAANAVFKSLTIQERCISAGKEYIDILKEIFNSKTVFNENKIKKLKTRINSINKYEFINYTDIFKMTDRVKELYDKNNHNCFTLSGYSWKNKNQKDFISKNNLVSKIGEFNLENYDKYMDIFVKNKLHNIEIGEYKNIWNGDSFWFDSETARNEVGCIHVSAGLDIEYAGVIIGKDLFLNDKDMLECNPSEFYDKNTKRNATKEELLEFILDSYYILLTRGRHGTFIYACDPKLQALLTKIMKTIN